LREAALPFSVTEAGLRLSLRVTPNASRVGFDGIAPGADGRPVLRLRVAAPAVDGAANAALIAFLAEALDLRKSAIRIASGETRRVKLVDLSGNGGDIAARLTALIARQSD
jgi:uncharacterized protein